MAEALNVVPKDTSPGTGIRDVDKVAEAYRKNLGNIQSWKKAQASRGESGA